jgi:hypothetical protein
VCKSFPKSNLLYLLVIYVKKGGYYLNNDIKDEYLSIRGWLKVIFFAIIIHVILSIYQLNKIFIKDFFLLFNSEITGDRIIEIICLLVNIIFIIFEIILVFLMNNLSPKLPISMIIFCFLNVCFISYDIINIFFWIKSTPAIYLIIGECIRLILVIVLMVYFIKSKRVKLTFQKKLV